MQTTRHYKPSVQYNLAITQFQSFHLSIWLYFGEKSVGKFTSSNIFFFQKSIIQMLFGVIVNQSYFEEKV